MSLVIETAAMKLRHHDLQIELYDTWWAESGIQGFAPLTKAYLVDSNAANGRKLFHVRIDEVRPVRRNPVVKIFRDKKSVILILRGFVIGSAIPPVEIVFEPPDSKFRCKLVDGTHWLYCSLAAGFSHIPAVEGWEPENRTSYSNIGTLD